MMLKWVCCCLDGKASSLTKQLPARMELQRTQETLVYNRLSEKLQYCLRKSICGRGLSGEERDDELFFHITTETLFLRSFTSGQATSKWRYYLVEQILPMQPSRLELLELVNILNTANRASRTRRSLWQFVRQTSKLPEVCHMWRNELWGAPG